MKDKQNTVGVNTTSRAPKTYKLSREMQQAALRAKFQVPQVSVAPRHGFQRND